MLVPAIPLTITRGGFLRRLHQSLLEKILAGVPGRYPVWLAFSVFQLFDEPLFYPAQLVFLAD